MRVLLWIKKIVKLIVKIVFWPVITICKIIVLPFLKIKQKLLSKKAKIALTFKRFCFKIKCNVGNLCVSEKLYKERKPCRKEQKPGKRV